MTVYNLKYGPWQTSRFGEMIREAAEDIANNWSANDPLLLKMFPSILLDRGLDPDAMNTTDHRNAFMRGLPNEQFIKKKPIKCSLSRFNSYSLAAQELDPDWSAMAWFLITLSVMQGWSSHVGECLSPPEVFCRQPVADGQDAVDPLVVGVGAASSSASRTPASSSSASSSATLAPTNVAPDRPAHTHTGRRGRVAGPQSLGFQDSCKG